MSGFKFNIDGGYLEGLCRGFKCGILKQSDYLNLVQCETLEGLYKNTIEKDSCDSIKKGANTIWLETFNISKKIANKFS